MANFPSNSDITNDNLSTAGLRAWLSGILAATVQLPGAAAPTTLTINAGRITPTGAFHLVATQGGAGEDDLDSIDGSNLRDGAFLYLLRATANNLVYVKHLTVSGDGRIALANGGNQGTFLLGQTNQGILLRKSGTTFEEVCVRASGIPFNNRFYQEYVTPGTYNWTVPENIYQGEFWYVPAGGGGGGGAGCNAAGTWVNGTNGSAGGNLSITGAAFGSLTATGGAGGAAAAASRGGIPSTTNQIQGQNARILSGVNSPGEGAPGLILYRGSAGGAGYGGGGSGGAGGNSTGGIVTAGGGGASGQGMAVFGPQYRLLTPGDELTIVIPSGGSGGSGGVGDHSSGQAGQSGQGGFAMWWYQ